MRDKLFFWGWAAALVMLAGGCFTRATAYTKRTPDGTTLSRVSVVGTGDKASQIAAEGLFADGADEDLGAGVHAAQASQESSGIQGTLAGLGALLQGLAQFSGAHGAPAFGGVSGGGASTEAAPKLTYSTEGFGAQPGEDGSGVYGRPSCLRSRNYHAAHGVELVNIDTPEHRAAMWDALRTRGFDGDSVDLPVIVTADGYKVKVQ